jgi:hypothetical protein
MILSNIHYVCMSLKSIVTGDNSFKLMFPIISFIWCTYLFYTHLYYTWYEHWFWMRIFPFYLTRLTDFDCGLFRLPNIDTLILTTDIWSGALGGCDQSAEDAYSSMAPDPTFAFVEGPCCPTLDFVIAFWLRLRFTHCKLH